jgi:hypothetical protein
VNLSLKELFQLLLLIISFISLKVSGLLKSFQSINSFSVVLNALLIASSLVSFHHSGFSKAK